VETVSGTDRVVAPIKAKSGREVLKGCVKRRTFAGNEACLEQEQS